MPSQQLQLRLLNFLARYVLFLLSFPLQPSLNTHQSSSIYQITRQPLFPSPPLPPPPPPHLLPLLTALRTQHSQGFSHPLWSKIGSELHSSSFSSGGNEGKGSLKELIKEAERGGWVESGRGKGEGREWVRLRKGVAKKGMGRG